MLRPADEKTEDPVAAIKGLAIHFHKALTASVMEPSKATLSAEAAELYPTKLPPLRSDTPTLVVGRFAKDKVPASVELSIQGKVGGDAATANVTLKMPEPSADNYFLGSLVTQWRDSGRTEEPAILQADRTLALAYEGTRLTREEFLEQANWAVGAKKFDAAKSLFNAALKLDPSDPRGKAGAKLVNKLEKGEVSLEQLRKASVNTIYGARVDVDQLVQDKKGPKELPPPAAKAGTPADSNALLRQAEAQQRIREQQVTVAVDETLARALRPTQRRRSTQRQGPARRPARHGSRGGGHQRGEADHVAQPHRLFARRRWHQGRRDDPRPRRRERED